jgi:hypothetical protein
VTILAEYCEKWEASMASKLIKTSLLFMALSHSALGASVECYYHFTDSILTIEPTMKVNACTADFIWGKDNVCFKGSAKDLAKKINQNYYRWNSSGLRVSEAEVESKDSVSYLGIDAQSFYSAERTIYRCQ